MSWGTTEAALALVDSTNFREGFLVSASLSAPIPGHRRDLWVTVTKSSGKISDVKRNIFLPIYFKMNSSVCFINEIIRMIEFLDKKAP